MIKNAYQGGEIRKAAPPLNDKVAAEILLIVLASPFIAVAIVRFIFN